MNNHTEIEALINQSGFTDFKWIDPRKIIVSEIDATVTRIDGNGCLFHRAGI